MRFSFFILFLASLGCSAIFHLGNQQHRPDLFGITNIYIQNTGDKAAPLYSTKNPNTKIKSLEPGGKILFSLAGSTGKWFYGLTDNNLEVILKDNNRQKVITLWGITASLPELKYYSGIASIVFFALFILVTIYTWVQGKRREKAQRLMNAEINERQTRVLQENIRLKQNLELSQREIQTTNRELEKSKLDIEKIQTAHSNNLMEEKKKLEAIFKKQQEALNVKIFEEAEKRTNVKISEMQASYDRINSEYEKLTELYINFKSECKIFDIDFDSTNYENILKGRKFEIYFATKLTANPKFEILEWTSDKGTEHNIKVRANGNPDFVIAYKESKHEIIEFSVECKYRGTDYFKTNKFPNYINWGSKKQSERYTKFGVEREIPVYLALGCCKSPEQPEFTFFIELEELVKKSILDKPKRDSEDEYLIKKSEIEKQLLNPETFSAQALKTLREEAYIK